jgi:peptide/nickel transport system substrate-binding protein
MRLRFRAVVAVVAVSTLAAACSGSSGSKAAGGSSSSSTPSGTPKVGGNLTMGTETEIDGFDPTSNRWDTTGYMYAWTVYDPLATFGKDNKVHPYLAQSITPSADYKTWTITLRPNIKFSNGDPLTGADVATDLTAIKTAPLTGKVFDPVDSFTATGPLTVTVTCNIPWPAFPTYIVGQAGAVFDPVMLKDPNRSEHPIGTGPFILQSWVPNDHFTAVRNPNYWQKGLPYLNSVTYRPLVELQSRESTLQTGGIQIMHSSDPQATFDLKGKSGINILDEANFAGQQSQDFVMLNTAQAPLNDVTLRTALAYATNVKQIISVEDYNLVKQSDGPFSNPASTYYEPTGYPQYNLAKAKQLVQQYETAHHVSSVSFSLGAVNSARDLAEAELIQAQWKQAGINTTITQVQQSQYILLALEGKYAAFEWRQFGDADPDADYIWWSSTTALPIGQLALNFARNKDPQIQTDLDTGRTSTDVATRVAAYKDVAKRFAIDIPYLWINSTLWQIIYNNQVQGLTTWTLPDGTPGADHTIGGVFFMSHVWLS